MMNRYLNVLAMGLMVFILSTIPIMAQEAEKDKFEDRLALSIFIGAGIPVGDFSSSSKGNHEAGGVDVSLDVEWYFAKSISMGFSIYGGIYDDKTYGEDLQTDINSVGVFGKYTLPAGGKWYPFGKLGIGYTELDFDDPALTVKVEGNISLVAAVGVLWRVSNLISVNGQTAYNHAFLKDSKVKVFNEPLGFDAQYIAIDAGVSFYISL